MITNGLAEEHWHSIQAKFYAILTKNGNYTRIFVGDTFGQSVSKVMTHLTVFGEFSSIPNLGKTSTPPPCKMLTRHEMTIVPERVINIDLGGGGKSGKRYFFRLWCDVHQENSKILQSVSRVLQPIVGQTKSNERWSPCVLLYLRASTSAMAMFLAPARRAQISQIPRIG